MRILKVRTPMLNFNDVTIRRGPRVLFSGATFSLFRGEKVGITGENGTGKSSLLALVRGVIHTDAGTFEMPGNLELAHVSQDLEATDQPAIEFVLDGDPELRDLERSIETESASEDGHKLADLYGRYGEIGGYDARSRAGKLMHGLGFSSADEARPIRAFSGGWRVRINVAQALMCRSDLLLLDEPTNHLDLDAILWLENWLREYPGTLLLIAHDREFLDRVVNRVVNLEHGKAHAYRGNYSDFETQRAAELSEQSALLVRQQREIRHMESFVARFRASASKARQAQSRIKALERMQRIAPAHVDSSFEFSFAEPAKLPRPLLALEDQSVGYGGVPLLEHIRISISPGDRIALLGRNGAGKSTFMKLLAGELPALGGTRTEARDLKIGYFAQHQLEQLSLKDSALDNLRQIEKGLGLPRSAEQDLRDFLAGFGFRGDRVFEPIEPLSGGEKARLVLALIAWQKPNLLLLDEPTNHLDLEMRRALAVALQEYAGAVVMVSHDRHLLQTVADELHVVHGGRAEVFDGDLDDYARWLNKAGPAAPAKTADGSAAAANAGAAPQRNPAKSRKQGAQARQKLEPLRAAVTKCEAELERLASETAAVHAQLLHPEQYSAGISQKLAELAKLTARAEEAWLRASEALEQQGS
ncbi:MAG TPA: ATP-binding cassette domain-containing protein [Steroidobacteraceae bacterium]|nr:ATP-binding cassette domain-containing protein [Steroidobacteraceae bacterium]